MHKLLEKDSILNDHIKKIIVVQLVKAKIKPEQYEFVRVDSEEIRIESEWSAKTYSPDQP